MNEREDGEKMEGIKKGALPYDATSSFPTIAIINLQMIVGFCYFHFHINMLKWRSSIFGFVKKFPTTFLIQQPTKTCKKGLTICEVFFSQNVLMKCFFLKSKLFLSCRILAKF
jgi:hypothetical protein